MAGGGEDMKFTIPGEPKAKQRARTLKTGRSYTPEQTVNYENWVKQCYLLSDQKERLEGQIEARIKAFFSIPKSTSKAKREQMLNGEIRPIKKPDLSNVIKSIEDGLNSIAYSDDSQIVKLVAMKYYSNEPRVEVELISID